MISYTAIFASSFTLLPSVVVLDNCSIHHISKVQQELEGISVLVHYLPPYSPDYNPIAKAFSKVKKTLRNESDETLNKDS